MKVQAVLGVQGGPVRWSGWVAEMSSNSFLHVS